LINWKSFYPVSHKCGQLPHDTRQENEENDSNLLSLGQYISKEYLQNLPNTDAISISLQGGQATLHSFDCVHASGPNQSSQPRVGLALRYMTANVIQTNPVREMATWISGIESEEAHFDLEPQLPARRSVNRKILKEGGWYRKKPCVERKPTILQKCLLKKQIDLPIRNE
jgi:ectoine hydroxylase-related dioxygenase (phytanoyl-CoA dioxygenase family)